MARRALFLLLTSCRLNDVVAFYTKNLLNFFSTGMRVKHTNDKNLDLNVPVEPFFIDEEPPEEIMITHDLPAITIQPIPSDDRNTWHDKLGFLIPNDLLPYVTEEPIYVSKNQEKLKGKHHTPEFRESMVSDLIHFQDHFHKQISKLTDRRQLYQDNLDKGKSVSKNKTRLEQLEQDFAKFKVAYHSVIDTRAIHHRLKGDTTDDTKELEFRPHKRSDNMSLDNIRHTGSVKKFRSDLLTTDDVNVSIFQDL
ncbi:hypothetical protein RhiirA5_382950 [Rhizophagus irregularis]|uniref:Uncharacterized protein n=1 Tax=Rhizophagus irregularis TaxID=588596 RepID=A0A2N0NYX0_9GLOM|nr:hypothetical protein RhiirA5_382950 [Rhizophagus irregularis]